MEYSAAVEAIKQVAIRALCDTEDIDRTDVRSATIQGREFTSAVTATFYVRVEMADETYYSEIPVAVRVSYSHPVAV